MKTLGLILVGIGFLAILVGAGTADMELATSSTPKILTGVPLALVGLALVSFGVSRINRRDD